ncbi:MAG: hypothetical protein H7249_06780 [Chitinophagaceae bacterium]|nr:hypothetical protein [Oligoflexus sp.]
MNVANPCKMFLMVGALAAGFAVRADGTLPIPVANKELPFQLIGHIREKSVSGLGNTATTQEISMTLDAANPSATIDPKFQRRCRPTESFYPAAGSVQVADDLFDIQGVCAPGATTVGPRQIIATSTGRILQFDGSFVVDASKSRSFKGNLLKIDSVTTTPETGATTTKTSTFELHQAIAP